MPKMYRRKAIDQHAALRELASHRAGGGNLGAEAAPRQNARLTSRIGALQAETLARIAEYFATSSPATRSPGS